MVGATAIPGTLLDLFRHSVTDHVLAMQSMERIMHDGDTDPSSNPRHV